MPDKAPTISWMPTLLTFDLWTWPNFGSHSLYITLKIIDNYQLFIWIGKYILFQQASKREFKNYEENYGETAKKEAYKTYPTNNKPLYLIFECHNY